MTSHSSVSEELSSVCVGYGVAVLTGYATYSDKKPITLTLCNGLSYLPAKRSAFTRYKSLQLATADRSQQSTTVYFSLKNCDASLILDVKFITQRI